MDVLFMLNLYFHAFTWITGLILLLFCKNVSVFNFQVPCTVWCKFIYQVAVWYLRVILWSEFMHYPFLFNTLFAHTSHEYVHTRTKYTNIKTITRHDFSCARSYIPSCVPYINTSPVIYRGGSGYIIQFTVRILCRVTWFHIMIEKKT